MQGSIRSPQLGQEYPQPNEEAMFREMGEIIEKLMIRTRSPVQRQQHAKHHGCVHATFEIEQNLPNELRIGLFREVASYPAWVRFSNASQHIDTIGNPHGFAIKLMGVKGAKALGEGHDHETQDFLMADYPIFIVRTASDYLDLFRAALNAPGKTPWSFFFPSLDPSKWRLRELGLRDNVPSTAQRARAELRWAIAPGPIRSRIHRRSLRLQPHIDPGGVP